MFVFPIACLSGVDRRQIRNSISNSFLVLKIWKELEPYKVIKNILKKLVEGESLLRQL